MDNKTILIAITALLLGVVGTYVIIGNDNDHHKMGEMTHERIEDDRDHKQMPSGNMDGMDHSMMMVQSEREFLTGMIPHHQEAVDTAKEVIERGGSTPEVKQLVEGIVIAQEKEIAKMKQWYQDWYGEAYEEKPEDYQPMMRELADLSGAELDQRFLEDMIMHHMGAIMMARTVQPYIEHQEVKDLTMAIVETQTNEIELMQELLRKI